MSKLFTDEIQKTGLYNRPIQVINAGLNMAFAEATVTNFDGLVEVTLDLSLGNYFVLDMNKCNSDVKEISLINSQNSAFNSFVLEVHQVKSGTPLYIDWSVMTSFKWSEGVQPILKNTYNSVDIYSFMNVGGYIYLTQENDTDRLNDTDYAIRLEDDESIITETFTMSYVIGAILSIDTPYHQSFQTRNSTAYGVTGNQYTLTPGHGIGKNVMNFGRSQNKFKLNANIDYPGNSPYNNAYLRVTTWTDTQVLNSGTVNPGPGLTPNSSFSATTTVGQDGSLVSFNTPTELQPLFDGSGNGVPANGWIDGEYNKRDFIIWDYTNTSAINDTRAKINLNDVRVDFDTSTGVHEGGSDGVYNVVGYQINYNDGNGYQNKDVNTVTTNWVSKYDFEKIYETFYLQREHPTKIFSDGNGTDFAFECLLSGTQSYTYSGNSQTYGEDLTLVVHYPGKNFTIDEIITIKGSLLGGTDDTDDILIKVKNLTGTISQINLKTGGSNYSSGQYLHFSNEIYYDDPNSSSYILGNLFCVDQSVSSGDLFDTRSVMLKISQANDVYRISGKTHPTYADSKPTITVRKNRTYVFDFSDSSFATQGGHLFYLSLYDNGDDGGGHNNASVYTNGVTYSTETPGTAGAKVTFKVPNDAPNTLYYYNINTSNAGGTINVIEDDSGKDFMLLESSNVYSSVVGQNFSTGT